MAEATGYRPHPVEKLTSVEQERKSPFDAIHVIEYELNEQRKPNTPGLMGINTAVELVNAGVSDTVIISGMHYKGKGEDSRRISEVYADELRKRTQEASPTIIPEAQTLHPLMADLVGSKDTGGDVSFLQRQARSHNWNNILVVAYEPHAERINTLLENRGVHIVTDTSPARSDEVNVTIISSNDFLQSLHPDFKERFENSPYRQQEGTKFSDKEVKKKETMRKYDPKGYVLSTVARLMPQSIKEKFQS